MKTEWQDYESIINEPKNIKAIELVLSKEKPTEDSKGFVIDTPFQYIKPDDSSKLWIRFWVLED